MTKNRLLIFLLVSLMVSACDNKKEQQSEYHYYPDLNLYYDVAHNYYLFSLDGGATWDSVDAKTQTIPEALGPKVVLYTTGDSIIWTQNELHRKQYNGYVYNVAAEDSTDSDTTLMVTEKKKPVKKVVVAEQPKEEVKEKKGLGKLLQKIFGKNKDKKEKNN